MSLFRKIYIDPGLSPSERALVFSGDVEVVEGFPEEDGKDILFVTRLKGRFFKPCPGTKNYICCGYEIFNLMMGCPFDCSYCVLQGYLGHLSTYFYTNYRDGFREIEEYTRSNKHLLRVGTGELGDSLAVEGYIPTAVEFVEFFSGMENVLFEFKTKSMNFDSLKGLDPKGRIVVSTSLSPVRVWEGEEKRTPDPISRIRALGELQRQGYLLGFHFDPMVWHEGWEDGYRELVEYLSRHIDPRIVIWISLGGLRFPKELWNIIERRHRDTTILYGELLPCGLDGKFRYFKPIRVKMYKFLINLLKEWSSDLFIYFCMESGEVWEEVFGFSPGSMKGLDTLFVEREKVIRTRI